MFHPCNAAFKADSRTSRRIPGPKSLTKFAVFESVFCQFFSTVLAAECLFKGTGRVSDKLQDFWPYNPPGAFYSSHKSRQSCSCCCLALRKWSWTRALHVTRVPSEISRSFFTPLLRNKTSLNNSCLPPVCCSKISLAGIHQSKPQNFSEFNLCLGSSARHLNPPELYLIFNKINFSKRAVRWK